MIGPQASVLPGGRLHLHHGPIDLIIGVSADTRAACFEVAADRFDSLLAELVEELPSLRKPVTTGICFDGPVAQRMLQAVKPHRHVFVTPMAAVAGSVADEVLSAMVGMCDPAKAYVNNGGDIAFHLGGAASFSALGPAGDIEIKSTDSVRGIATSGWRGRSHSRGIADAVTVLAPTAAEADVAATLIANVVDLPRHPGVIRAPARDLNPDSDLEDRLVTTGVATLTPAEKTRALVPGLRLARMMMKNGLINDSILLLQGTLVTASSTKDITIQGSKIHA